MHVSGIFDLYNPANRDLTKANTVLLIWFGSGRSKLVKLLDRIRSIYGRTVRSLINTLSAKNTTSVRTSSFPVPWTSVMLLEKSDTL